MAGTIPHLIFVNVLQLYCLMCICLMTIAVRWLLPDVYIKPINSAVINLADE